MTQELPEKPGSVPVGELRELETRLSHKASERKSASGEQPWDYEARGIEEAIDGLRELIERYE